MDGYDDRRRELDGWGREREGASAPHTDRYEETYRSERLLSEQPRGTAASSVFRPHGGGAGEGGGSDSSESTTRNEEDCMGLHGEAPVIQESGLGPAQTPGEDNQQIVNQETGNQAVAGERCDQAHHHDEETERQ